MEIIFILGAGFSRIMAKKECKDGKCQVSIPNFSIKENIEQKVDKKDSSKRLR